MNITIQHVEVYLKEIKSLINEGNYRIELNRNRPDNLELFDFYQFDERKIRSIFGSLTPEDFCEVLIDRHSRDEDNLLYVFCKDVKLQELYGSRMIPMTLYIKFRKIRSEFVIVISFHQQKKPMNYLFRKKGEK